MKLQNDALILGKRLSSILDMLIKTAHFHLRLYLYALFSPSQFNLNVLYIIFNVLLNCTIFIIN